MNIKATFGVTNTTKAVVEIRSEKNSVLNMFSIFEIIYVNCGLRNENESDFCSYERYLQSPHMLLSVNLLLHLFSALSRYQDTLKSINLNRFSCMLCKNDSDIFLLRNLISLLPN